MKLAAGYQAHSAAVVADGFESLTDIFTSGLVLVGLILAARPADSNHPYGHGRVETLAGLLLGFILLVAGASIAWNGWAGAGQVIRVPEAWAIWPMVISIAAHCAMMTAKYRQARISGSTSLEADAANDAVDILSGSVALGGLWLAVTRPERFAQADHYGAFFVGLIVMAMALRVMYRESLYLMDTMPGDEAIRRIRRVACGVADVKDVEKCYARRTGAGYHVDLHLEVDPEISVRASHDIAERVRNEIRRELNWVADVLVHVEPWPGPK